MSDKTTNTTFSLTACHELLDSHPESLRIREQVEALEEALPDRPGVVVSFCRTIIETTCKTILTDRGVAVDSAWEAPKLVSEALRYVNLGPRDEGGVDEKLRSGAESLVRGLNQIVQGIVEIRNAHGSAAHGADAYSPLLTHGMPRLWRVLPILWLVCCLRPTSTPHSAIRWRDSGTVRIPISTS